MGEAKVGDVNESFFWEMLEFVVVVAPQANVRYVMAEGREECVASKVNA